jgi:hypothetical protein
MKKILFLFAFVPLILSGQSYVWHDSINAANVATDTVIQPMKVGESGSYSKNISGMGCTCTFIADDLTDTVAVNIGGSNYQVTSGNYAFSGFASDSLPYDLVKANLISVKNGDTSYIKTISLEPHIYGFKYSQIKVTFDATDNTSALSWYCLFYKR